MLLNQPRLASRLRRSCAKAQALLHGAFAAIAAALFFGLLSPADAQRRPMIDEPGSFMPGQIIVGLKAGTTAASMNDALRAVDMEIMRPLRLSGYYLARIKPVQGQGITEKATQDAALALRNTNLFKFARPNYYMWKTDTNPNDPVYPQQWHYPLIGLPKAWDLTLGTPNVVVCVLDTGGDVTHPDLSGNIHSAVNFTVQPNDNNVTDVIGHGTHVAGTITAKTNNNVGVAGVTWGTTPLFFGKVLGDQGFGTWADITDGIMYCADTIKTSSNDVVINMSLGAAVSGDVPDLSWPHEAACHYAATVKNCIVSMAAGNDYQNGNSGFTPARVAQLDSRLFCVASCGGQKEHAAYSQARPYTTISAPGGNGSMSVISTVPVSQGSYSGMQGTSMAAPHLAGVAALVLGFGIPPSEVKQIITSTADTGGRQVPNDEFGFGVVDVYAAVTQAASAISLVSPTSGQYVYGNVNVQLKVGDPSKYVKAELILDNGTAAVDTATSGDYQLNWNSLVSDPATGAPQYANGAHKITVRVTTPTGFLTLVRNVRLDNPIALFTNPAANGFVSKTVSVNGTADGLRVPTYTLEYATTAAPSTWNPIVADQVGRVTASELAPWDLVGVTDGNAILRLRVKNPDGFEVSSTRPIVIDQTPPTIPTDLTGVGTHLTVNLNWGGSTDPAPGQFAGFNLYRSLKSLTGYQKINAGLLSNATYVDTGLTNAFTYFYKVTAVDMAGNESAPTDVRDVTPNRNGTIGGQIIGLDGTFLEGASVSVRQNGTQIPNGHMKTDTAGQFTFPGPPGFNTGSYDVVATKGGYVSQIIRDVSVDIGRDATAQNFALQPQPRFDTGWTMFTLPYDFSGKDLSAVFSGSLVKYYSTTLGRYVDPGEEGFPKPAPGIGYWLNKTGNTSVTGSGVPNKPVLPVEVPIRKGWNLLGNPFQDPIHWVLSSLIIRRADTGLKSTLNLASNMGWALDFAWGGARGKTLLFDRTIVPGVIDTIPGYGAFWFFSDVEGTLSIAPPAIVSRAAKESSSNWSVEINAQSGDQGASAYVGIGGTHRLVPVPPQVEAGVKVTLGDKGGYAADLRTNAGATQTWELTVEGADSKPVTLTWPGAARIPRGWNMALVDRANGQRINLRSSSSLTLPATRSAHKLQVELTRETYDRLRITDLTVNAGRGSSPAISFGMSREARTTVSIVQANGTAVRTLVSRSVPSGNTAMVWDARDDRGRNVASGVYMVQVRAVGDKGDQARAVLPFVITR